jgi:hypothetical protein
MKNKAPWLLLLAFLSAAPACASGGYVYGRDSGYGGYRAPERYSRNVQRVARQHGYREGREAGEQDARRRRAFSPGRHDDWRDADEGYRREYGNRQLYRREFREGFRRGYADGYRAYARGYRR